MLGEVSAAGYGQGRPILGNLIERAESVLALNENDTHLRATGAV